MPASSGKRGGGGGRGVTCTLGPPRYATAILRFHLRSSKM